MRKIRFASIQLIVAFFLTTATTSRAGLQIPYTPDASTLHLWHLDEPSTIYTSTDAVATSSITLTNIGWPTPGGPPYTNTSLGNPSFTGLGTCETAINKGHLLYGGNFPDVSQFRNPVSGAFTFEAVVKFDINPLGAIDAEIVAGDNGGGLGVRGWQWRIFNGVMEWNLLAGNGGDNDFKSTLPSTGPNAAIAGTWYHVAVTYTGSSPTNSDAPNQLTFYWTLLDANRVAADKLGQFTMSRPLDGSPSGTSTPNLGVGGSGRVPLGGNVGNNEGLIGSIDEVRISLVARGSNEMAFVTGGALNPPSFTTQPPTNVLVGFGKTLTVAALVSGTPTLSYQWRQNGANLAAQTNLTLVISNVNFANAGSYQLVVTNPYGSKTSSVCLVTVGGAPTGLFNTGLDTNGVVSAGDIPDPHWTLYRSADAVHLGPNAPIFEYAFPIQFADPNGAFSPTNGLSMWIGAAGNQGGVAPTSPAGQYIYRSTFLIDTADPATVTASGNLWTSGTIADILVNGKSTGTTLNPGGTLYVITYAITNGFVPGVNTLDFVENTTGNAITGLRVEVQSVGQALPPGLPVITNQPANQVVRDGTVPPNNSHALFSVVALGRPPLNYQWWADGALLSGATDRVLEFVNPTAGAQGTNFFVVVSNDSGSVTSQVASLTLVASNQPPVAAGFSSVAFQGGTFTLPLSDLVQKSVDPDYDPISFVSADSVGTNGVSSVAQIGATLVYTPSVGYVGSDSFTYTISDDQGATAVGTVYIFDLNAPTNEIVPPGGTASFDVGLLTPPAGYSFQWQFNGTNIASATGGQLTINNAQLANAGGYTLVVIDPLGQKWTSPLAGLTVGIAGTGTGLTGDYYGFGNGTTNFTGLPTLTRLDPTVDFNFGTGAPDPSLPVDMFQIRWHGQVQPFYSDTYTFYTTTDDGSRLWVNGQLLVNQWVNQAATTASGTIALQAGQKYDILMEYYENTSVASAQLSWSSIHQARQVIPTTQLYPGTGLVSPTLTANIVNRNLVLNWAGTFMLQSAPSVTGPWTSTANSFIGPFTTPVTGAQQSYYRLVDPISP
jgi:hypothetical protein